MITNRFFFSWSWCACAPLLSNQRFGEILDKGVLYICSVVCREVQDLQRFLQDWVNKITNHLESKIVNMYVFQLGI